ncbi:DUF3318 domain-containing protein [Paraburkholderia dipogonis]|uniref:DUF3318 domain-containing protein n=1 Tax=Paraburkholderia dipogonis TaxID=1211383 RepID=UPI0038B760C7
MSPTRPDTAFRSKRPPANDLGSPHLRALRKELLILRADVERVELAQATVELRRTVIQFSWLKFLVPGLAGMGWGAKKGAKAALGTLLIKHYPLLRSLASLLLAQPLRATIVKGAKPVIRWGGLALAAWEAYRIWQQIRQDRHGTPPEMHDGNNSAT